MTDTTTEHSEPCKAVGAPVEQPVRPCLTDEQIEACWIAAEAEAEAESLEDEWLLYGQKVALAAEAAGRERCAAWVEARRDAFCEEHGSIDPDTGTLEFGRGQHADAKSEYVGELEEIAAGLRALKA